MHKKETVFQKIMSVLVVILGNMIYALALKLFLLPSNLMTGGTTGIALAVKHYTGFNISGVILIFNIAMLIVGFIVLGKKFALTTIISTFAYPISLEFFNRLFSDLVLTDNILLCTIFSGLGIGIGLAIVIRSGASTGGMDIPPLVLNHFFRIPVSVSLYVFDFTILIFQAAYNPVDNVLYGIILVMIYTIVLDKLLVFGTTRIEVKVMSNEHEKIRQAIITEMDRGVTALSARSGYMDEPTQMIFSVISNRELPRIEKIIREIDPESFVVVSHVSEVRGHGFSLEKKYK